MTHSHRQVILREVRATLKLRWPIMGAQALWMSMFVVDNIMVGHLGKEALGINGSGC